MGLQVPPFVPTGPQEGMLADQYFMCLADDFIRWVNENAALAIEAQRAETEGFGAKHESATQRGTPNA